MLGSAAIGQVAIAEKPSDVTAGSSAGGANETVIPQGGMNNVSWMRIVVNKEY